MGSILNDSKNKSKLYIATGESSGVTEYTQINPQTLASVVVDETDGNSEYDIKNVQKHIDDKDIHFTMEDVSSEIEASSKILKAEIEGEFAESMKPSNIIGGEGISVVPGEEGTNDVIISATGTSGGADVTKSIFSDETIIVEKDESEKTVTLKVDTEVVAEMIGSVTADDFIAGDGITIENIIEEDEEDEETVKTKVKISGTVYTAGEGISIDEDNVITNTAEAVDILAGNERITVEKDENHPIFTISASSGNTIVDWESGQDYYIGDFVIYCNSIYRCKETYTSGELFEKDKWDLIAGYNIQKYYYLEENFEMTTLVLPKEVPDKGVLQINANGLIIQAQNYELKTDGVTIQFTEGYGIPKGILVEVSVAGNEVINQLNEGVTIYEWEAHKYYVEKNVVLWNNNLYKCLISHASSDEFDESKWEIIAGYVKHSMIKNITTPTSTIALVKEVFDKNDLLINVNGSILTTDNYDITADKQNVVFKNPLQAGDKVEILIYNNTVLQQLNIPAVEGHPSEILQVNEEGSAYILSDVKDIQDQMGLTSYTNFEGNALKCIQVNEDETDIQYVNMDSLSTQVGVRRFAHGLTVTAQEGEDYSYFSSNIKVVNDLITVKAGDIMSDDGLTMMHLKEDLVKDPNKEFGDVGTTYTATGSALEFSGDEWTQVVMTSPTTTKTGDLGYSVEADSEIADREAWRAMDVYTTDGNGWLGNYTKGTKWKFMAPKPIFVKSIDIYGQKFASADGIKNVSMFVNSENVEYVGSFTAEFVANTNVHTHVEVSNPKWDNIFGLEFNSSYGTSVGMKHIILNGLYATYVSKNSAYHIYLISNNDGSVVDVLTTRHIITNDELPEGFTRKVKIGSFRSDDNWHIYNTYPEQDAPTSFVNGGNVKIQENSIEQWVSDENDVAVKMVEQWGTSKPNNGYVTFTKPFKNKCLYVTANGYPTSDVTNEGFRVSSSVTSVMWSAKGY